MSDYFETPPNVLSTECLFKTTFRYILDELRCHVDSSKLAGPKQFLADGGRNYTKKFMECAKNRLRMYGSYKDLMADVKVYREFSDSNRFYGIPEDPYFSSAVIYYSTSGERYVTKQDLLIILQNMCLKILPDSMSSEARNAINSALKGHALHQFNHLEFVKYDERVLEDAEKCVKEIHQNLITTPEGHRKLERHLANGNFNKIFALYPKSEKNKDDDREAIENMKKVYKQLNPRQNRTEPMVVFMNTTLIMKHLLSIMERHPREFYPFDDYYDNTKAPITVRLFEDGEKKFVMKAELFYGLGKITGKKSKYQEEMHLFNTISIQDVHTIYGKRVEQFEFIRTPILRSKHRAVPIRGHRCGEFGQLAVDSLMDLLKSFIFGSRMFERNKTPNWSDIGSIIVDLDYIFKIDCKTPYFIRDGIMNKLLSNFEKVIKITEFIRTEEVRDVRSDGFTVEDLKEEIRRLSLDSAFPEIFENTQLVYEAVMKRKRRNVLRTCDMYDALENCQLICVFERVPEMKRFLHNQGGCRRVTGIKCDDCAQSSEEEEESLPASPPPPPPPPADSEDPSEDVLHPPSSPIRSQQDVEYIDESELRLNISQMKLEDANRRITEREKELMELKKEYRKMTEEKKLKLEEKQREIENLKKKVDRFTAASKENDDLKLRVSELEASNKKLEEHNLRQEATWQRSHTKYSTKITELENELTNGKKRTQKGLQDKLHEKTLENEKILMDFEALKVDFEEEKMEIQKKLVEKEEEKMEIQKDFKTLKAENEREKARNAEIEAEKTEILEKLNQKQEEFQEEKKKWMEEKERILKELEEKKETTEESEEIGTDMEDTEKEIQNLKNSHFIELSEKEQQITQLKTEMDQLKIAHTKKLLDKEKELVELKYDSEQTNRQKTKEIDDLLAEIRGKEDELTEMKRSSRKRLERKQNEIEDLRKELNNTNTTTTSSTSVAQKEDELRNVISHMEEEMYDMEEFFQRQEISFRQTQSELYTRISFLESGLSAELQKSSNLECILQKMSFDNRFLHQANIKLHGENLASGNAIRETIHRFQNLYFSYTS